MRDLKLWLRLFVFRIVMAVCTISADHPDELWQFHEPAHAVVFGRGHFTWDWRAGIRSFVFPLPLIAAFQVAKLFGKFGFSGIEDAIVQVAPIVIRTFWCSITDLYTFKLAGKYFGPLAGKWALLFILTSHAQAEIGNRAFSNSFETALCAVVAFLWPRNRREWSKLKWAIALTVLGLTCLVRISAAQMFIPAAAFLFLYAPSPVEVLGIAIPLMAAIVAFGVAVDSFFYGKITVSWWNFFEWNVVKNVSSHFGVEPYSFYFKTLKKELLGIALPFTIFGLYKSLSRWKTVFPFFMFVLPYYIFCSLQPHKENRFLLPILPFLFIYAAHGGQQIELWLHKRPRIMKEIASLALIGFVIYNSCVIVRMISLQTIAPWNTIQDLRSRVSKLQGREHERNETEGIFLLATCHNFPNYGVFHLNYPLTFIPCAPYFSHDFFRKDPDFEFQIILNALFQSGMVRETLEFYLNDAGRKRPKFVVVVGYNYLDRIEEFRGLGYEACGRHVNYVLDTFGGRDSSLNDVFILCSSK